MSVSDTVARELRDDLTHSLKLSEASREHAVPAALTHARTQLLDSGVWWPVRLAGQAIHQAALAWCGTNFARLGVSLLVDEWASDEGLIAKLPMREVTEEPGRKCRACQRLLFPGNVDAS